ncbi:MAG: glycosyltransferase family 4 protein [Thermoguttaceae bacterium]|jgi:glycosyltransferase involved in cell wall biosynthesis
MPRLLLLCEYPTLNGGEQSMLSTLDAVAAAGFSLAAVAPPRGPLAAALAARQVDVLPWHAHGDCPDFRVAIACDRSENGTVPLDGRIAQGAQREELARLVRGYGPDLLDANSLAMGRLSGPVAAELGVPGLAHVRDIVRLGTQAMADVNRHRRLLAVSQATRDFHVAQGMAAERVRVLYNGVDLARFCPRPGSGYLHRELGLLPQARLIGTIGQISLRKGQDLLVEAAAMLAQQRPAKGDSPIFAATKRGSVPEIGTIPVPVHYLMVGERFSGKDESRRFEAAVRQATERLPGFFHWLGSRTDVDRLLGELTLLVHPARQEPLGRVLLEAAAAGVAVVATDVGGTREIFPPQSRSARLVPAEDAAALALAMQELLADPAERARLSAAARQRAEEQFDLRLAAAELVRHYQEVLEGYRP